MQHKDDIRDFIIVPAKQRHLYPLYELCGVYITRESAYQRKAEMIRDNLEANKE